MALRQRAEELFGPAVAARIRVLSYLDDFVILAPPEMAEEAAMTTSEALRQTGYIPSWPKLLIWHPNGPPRGAPDWLVRAWTNEGMILLGVPQMTMGAGGFTAPPPVWAGSQAFQQGALADASEGCTRALDSLTEFVAWDSPPRNPKMQVAWQVARLCIHSRMIYLLRSTHTENIISHASIVDMAIRARLLGWLGVAGDPEQYASFVFHLPLRLGGMGFPRLASLAAPAFVGSWALVASRVRYFVGGDPLDPEGLPHLGLHGFWAAWAGVTHLCPEDLPPWAVGGPSGKGPEANHRGPHEG